MVSMILIVCTTKYNLEKLLQFAYYQLMRMQYLSNEHNSSTPSNKGTLWWVGSLISTWAFKNLRRCVQPFCIQQCRKRINPLRLFPLSLIVKASTWFAKLSKNTITMWDDLVTAFNAIFFPPNRMMKLMDNI